jgi:alanine dehydrogenase
MTHVERPEAGPEQQKYAMRAPPVFVLHDSETGEPLALLLGELGAAEIPPMGVNGFRTACTSAVGLDELAPPDATEFGILGSGAQARNHLVAFDHVRDVESVRVYSPTEAHREAFAAEMTDYTGADIAAVPGPEAVVERADVVLAATDASSPVFDGNLLEPGQTVISIVGSNIELVDTGHAPSPRREVDNATMERADLIAVNSVEQAREYRQADLVEPIEAGCTDWETVQPLRDVVGGNHPGRQSADDVVVYKNNAGEGIIDVALATRVWEHVEAESCGVELDVYDPRA